MTETELDMLLIEAFNEADYLVNSAPSFTLKVNVFSEDLFQLMKNSKVKCCAFITAFNPLSNLNSSEVNNLKQSELESELKKRSLNYISGAGKDPLGKWPEEPSFLILDISLEAAKALGMKYEQNAILWSDKDAIPKLILLK